MTEEKERERTERFDWSVVSLAWRLGYTIAVPLVVFALLGRFADQAELREPRTCTNGSRTPVLERL